MPYSTAAKNAMLNHLGTLVTHASLHSADPGDSGASEIAGGAPAYARKAIAWNAAAAGAMDDTAAAKVFDVPAGTTVTHVGFWGAVSGGTFYGSDPIPNEAFGSQGTYSLTDVDIDLNA